jgi:hypothetical protein
MAETGGTLPALVPAFDMVVPTADQPLVLVGPLAPPLSG